MKNYKQIFDEVERTLFEVGSRNLSKAKIKSELDKFKHYEGKRYTDDEIFRKLIHIAFYSGFKAQIVSDKISVIDGHFPSYKTVADFGKNQIEIITNDPAMIRHRSKIAACVKNAQTLRNLINKYGSFDAFLHTLPPTDTNQQILALRDRFRSLFGYLGERTAFHFMMDIGIPVLKPDRVIGRIFKRLGLVGSDLNGDILYAALIQEAKKFSGATGHPIRYIDIVFVDYGQVQVKTIGVERGICVEVNPSCSICQASRCCGYFMSKSEKRDFA